MKLPKTDTPLTDAQRETMARTFRLVFVGRGTLARNAIGLDPADAHDIAVGALFRAVRSSHRPGLALYRICLKREFADWARSPRNPIGHGRNGIARQPRRHALDDYPADQPGFRAVDDLDECEPVLARARTRDRELIVARYLHDCQMKEIGQKFGLSESGASVAVAAATARIREVRDNPNLNRETA